MTLRQRPTQGKLRVLFSTAGDESAYEPIPGTTKIAATGAQQIQICGGLGFRAVCPRFFLSGGSKVNILDLPNAEASAFGAGCLKSKLMVPTLLSGCGKQWLEPSSGPKDFKYLTEAESETRFRRAVEVARLVGAKAIRVFSLYVPLGAWDALRVATEPHPEAVKYLTMVARVLDESAASGGPTVAYVENEKYLVGWSVPSVIALIQKVGSPRLLLALDPGNSQHVGFRRNAIRKQAIAAAKLGLLGSIHVKECARVPKGVADEAFTEAQLAPYHVLPGHGDAGLLELFRDLRPFMPRLAKVRKSLGLRAALEVMAEGHLNAGGPTDGNSGPNGLRDLRASVGGILYSLGIGY